MKINININDNNKDKYLNDSANIHISLKNKFFFFSNVKRHC